MMLAGASEPGMPSLSRRATFANNAASSSASSSGNNVSEPLLGLVNLMSTEDDELIKRSDERLTWASFVTVECWVLLSAAVMVLSKPESFEVLQGAEQQVALMAFLLMTLANLSRLAPLLYRDHVVLKNHPRSGFWKNGIFVAAATSQTIAMVTHFYMAFWPVPVVIDPVTGARVHLFRWAEWVCCCIATMLVWLFGRKCVPCWRFFVLCV